MGASSSSLLGDSRGGVIVLHDATEALQCRKMLHRFREGVSEESTQGMSVRSHTAGMCACQGWSEEPIMAQCSALL